MIIWVVILHLSSGHDVPMTSYLTQSECEQSVARIERAAKSIDASAACKQFSESADASK